MKSTNVILFLWVALPVMLTACGNTKSKSNKEEIDPIEIHWAVLYHDSSIAAFTFESPEAAIKYGRRAIAYQNIPVINKIVYLNAMGMFYNALWAKDSAKYYYKKAMTLAKNKPFYFYECEADYYLVDLDAKNALISLKKAYDICDTTVSINTKLASIYFGEYDTSFTNYKTALKYSRRAYETEPINVVPYAYMENLCRLDMYKEAEEIFERHKVNPTVDTYYLFYGYVIKSKLGKKSEAEVLQAKVIERDPAKTVWFKDSIVNNKKNWPFGPRY